MAKKIFTVIAEVELLMSVEDVTDINADSVKKQLIEAVKKGHWFQTFNPFYQRRIDGYYDQEDQEEDS